MTDSTPPRPVQLSLPLDAAPDPVRRHGLRAAHVAPRVGSVKDGRFWSGRVPASHAWAYPYIALEDAGATWASIVLDCDDRRAMAAGLPDLPPFNWMVRTPRGGHLTWCLASPVAKHSAARRAPETYLARVAEYYRFAVTADPAFSGLGRNPAHADARTIWDATAPYTLEGLSNVIPFNWRRPNIAATGIGRNVDMFRAGMQWAGQERNRGLPVLPALHAINAEIAAKHGKPPLPDSEIGSVARSVERYRQQWERAGWHKPEWLARQAARGRKGGRPRLYLPGLEPWTAEGVSRATWYRDRNKARSYVRQKPTQIFPSFREGRG